MYVFENRQLRNKTNNNGGIQTNFLPNLRRQKGKLFVTRSPLKLESGKRRNLQQLWNVGRIYQRNFGEI